MKTHSCVPKFLSGPPHDVSMVQNGPVVHHLTNLGAQKYVFKVCEPKTNLDAELQYTITKNATSTFTSEWNSPPQYTFS